MLFKGDESYDKRDSGSYVDISRIYRISRVYI